DFGLPVAEIVLQHHERLDGSGYPRALTGEDILPGARILAVADVVEAMSSYRPYRPALGIGAALVEIREHAGVTYAADVVATCVRLFEEQGFAFTL
ncbi:MAG TPA: HD domain-containing phosphohydrolase, partial [Thermoleophilia bacterium]|nr:HD domain-containing phosphohydrolase [Thermoleophilia bacterium]